MWIIYFAFLHCVVAFVSEVYWQSRQKKTSFRLLNEGQKDNLLMEELQELKEGINQFQSSTFKQLYDKNVLWEKSGCNDSNSEIEEFSSLNREKNIHAQQQNLTNDIFNSTIPTVLPIDETSLFLPNKENVESKTITSLQSMSNLSFAQSDPTQVISELLLKTKKIPEELMHQPQSANLSTSFSKGSTDKMTEKEEAILKAQTIVSKTFIEAMQEKTKEAKKRKAIATNVEPAIIISQTGEAIDQSSTSKDTKAIAEEPAILPESTAIERMSTKTAVSSTTIQTSESKQQSPPPPPLPKKWFEKAFRFLESDPNIMVDRPSASSSSSFSSKQTAIEPENKDTNESQGSVITSSTIEYERPTVTSNPKNEEKESLSTPTTRSGREDMREILTNPRKAAATAEGMNSKQKRKKKKWWERAFSFLESDPNILVKDNIPSPSSPANAVVPAKSTTNSVEVSVQLSKAPAIMTTTEQPKATKGSDYTTTSNEREIRLRTDQTDPFPSIANNPKEERTKFSRVQQFFSRFTSKATISSKSLKPLTKGKESIITEKEVPRSRPKEDEKEEKKKQEKEKEKDPPSLLTQSFLSLLPQQPAFQGSSSSSLSSTKPPWSTGNNSVTTIYSTKLQQQQNDAIGRKEEEQKKNDPLRNLGLGNLFVEPPKASSSSASTKSEKEKKTTIARLTLSRSSGSNSGSQTISQREATSGDKKTTPSTTNNNSKEEGAKTNQPASVAPAPKEGTVVAVATGPIRSSSNSISNRNTNSGIPSGVKVGVKRSMTAAIAIPSLANNNQNKRAAPLTSSSSSSSLTAAQVDSEETRKSGGWFSQFFPETKRSQSEARVNLKKAEKIPSPERRWFSWPLLTPSPSNPASSRNSSSVPPAAATAMNENYQRFISQRLSKPQLQQFQDLTNRFRANRLEAMDYLWSIERMLLTTPRPEDLLTSLIEPLIQELPERDSRMRLQTAFQRYQREQTMKKKRKEEDSEQLERKKALLLKTIAASTTSSRSSSSSSSSNSSDSNNSDRNKKDASWLERLFGGKRPEKEAEAGGRGRGEGKETSPSRVSSSVVTILPHHQPHQQLLLLQKKKEEERNLQRADSATSNTKTSNSQEATGKKRSWFSWGSSTKPNNTTTVTVNGRAVSVPERIPPSKRKILAEQILALNENRLSIRTFYQSLIKELGGRMPVVEEEITKVLKTEKLRKDWKEYCFRSRTREQKD